MAEACKKTFLEYIGEIERMDFETTCFNADGRSAAFRRDELVQKGKTWISEKPGFQFYCIERDGRIEISHKPIREKKGFRIHKIIRDQVRIALTEGKGSLLRSLNLCQFCGKPESEVRLPLFNQQGVMYG